MVHTKKNSKLQPEKIPNESVVLAAVNGETGHVYIEVEVSDKEILHEELALFDTGAGVSIISNTIVKKLQHKHVRHNTNVIRNASGNVMLTSGKITLTLKIGEKSYNHDYVISDEPSLPSNLILGWDFMRKHKVNLQTNPLSLHIENEKVTIVELPMSHALQITKTKEIPDREIVTDTKSYKCMVKEATLLEGERMSVVTLETNLIGSDTAIFEPVAGNIGTPMLCPGIVQLENDNQYKKARFKIRYINVTSENIELEPGKTLGWLQPCQRQNLTDSQQYSEVVNAITEKSEQERITGLLQTLNEMHDKDTNKHKILKRLILKYPSVFANDDDPPRVTPYYYHTIKLQSTPKPRKPYQIPVCFHDKVNTEIKIMEDHGLIRPSRSAFQSPLVPVVKKDGKIRLCVDFRNLNQHIINDSYPLPNINGILHDLGRGKLFSCLDLKQGYHQIPLSEESKEWTAFVAPSGLYEHNVLPMGLKDSPAAFCRIINQVLVGLASQDTHVYMDDIIIQGTDMENHVENLEKVLIKLREAKLRINLKKCHFFQTSVKYLGHIVSKEGLKPQPSKVEAINKIPSPSTVKELQSFLGMTNFYRKFIANYADIAAPLNKLIKGMVNKKGNKNKIPWNHEAEVAFVTLKKVLAEEVTLTFPNLGKPFFLTTDASNIAIGGVLQQKDEDNNLRPLTFFSRKLNKAEINYSTIEKEALSIVYGLKINRTLVLGYPVFVLTDHKPLKWLMTTSNANSRITRWQLQVAEFDIKIDYIPGKSNYIADCLSRLRHQDDDNIMVVTENQENNVSEWNLEKLISLQNEHPYYGILKKLFVEHDHDVEKITEDLRKQKVERKYKKLKLCELKLQNDILYRVAYTAYGEITRQVIIPESYVQEALHLGHSLPTAGHGGVQVTLARCQKFSFWPGMRRSVELFCRSCHVCNRLKRMGDAPAPLRSYPDVEMPFQRIHMDIVGPVANSDNNYKYCLSIIDVITRFIVLEPLKTKSATEVARVFVDQVICKLGIPTTLVTDQGKEFVNSVLQGVADLLQIKHIKITPYHPQANGVIERSNATIINILRTLVQDNVSIWDTMLPLTAFAYNCAYHRSIRDSPFYLMYLRDPPLPFEIMKEEKVWYDIDNFKEEMATKAQRVYARCQTYLEEAKGVSHRYQNKRAKIKPLKIGDRVYVRRVPTAGAPSKLQPAYTGPFRVTDKISDVVVKLKNVRNGNTKTIHTDRIRVMHEDNLSPSMNPNIRRAYPVHDEGESRNTRLHLTADPFLFRSADENESEDENAGDISRLGNDSNINDENTVGNESKDEQSLPDVQEISQGRTALNCPRYSLRSRSQVSDLPRVMDKPLEYTK